MERPERWERNLEGVLSWYQEMGALKERGGDNRVKGCCKIQWEGVEMETGLSNKGVTLVIVFHWRDRSRRQT